MRWYTSALRNSAFVGIQPQFRQIPPRASRSTSATCMPSWAARIAATYPPGPPPTITTSHVCCASAMSSLSRPRALHACVSTHERTHAPVRRMRLVASAYSLPYTQYGINIVNMVPPTVELLKEGHLGLGHQSMSPALIFDGAGQAWPDGVWSNLL